jgi:DNA polymerase-3 subunit alpha
VDIKKVKETYKDGQEVVVGGIIEECKDIFTKKGDKMLFIKLTDLSDTLELVVFPRVYTQFTALLKPENCVAIKGKVSHRNGAVSMIANKVKLLT